MEPGGSCSNPTVWSLRQTPSAAQKQGLECPSATPQPGPVSAASPTHVVSCVFIFCHTHTYTRWHMSHSGSETGMSNEVHIPSHISCWDSYPAAVKPATPGEDEQPWSFMSPSLGWWCPDTTGLIQWQLSKVSCIVITGRGKWQGKVRVAQLFSIFWSVHQRRKKMSLLFFISL